MVNLTSIFKYGVILLLITALGCKEKAKEKVVDKVEVGSDPTNIGHEKAFAFAKEKKIFEFKSLNCEENPNECATVSVKYPVVSTSKLPLQSQLVTDQIEQLITNTLIYKEDVIDMYSGAQSFIESYERFKKEGKAQGEEISPWYSHSEVSVIYQDSIFVSLQIETTAKEAFEREIKSIDIQTLNIEENSLLALEDLIKDKEGLLKLVEQKFRDFHGMNPTDDWKSNGFWFEDKFELTNNFARVPNGYLLIYNASEVGEPEKGITRIMLTDKEVGGLIK